MAHLAVQAEGSWLQRPLSQSSRVRRLPRPWKPVQLAGMEPRSWLPEARSQDQVAWRGETELERHSSVAPVKSSSASRSKEPAAPHSDGSVPCSSQVPQHVLGAGQSQSS